MHENLGVYCHWRFMCLNALADMELSDILKVSEEIGTQARKRSEAGHIIAVPRGCQRLARCYSPSRQ